MTQFMKERVDIISTEDLDEAKRYAQPFDEVGVDVHIRREEGHFVVSLFLPQDMPLATVRGGILQDVANMPPGWRLLVADYDEEGTEPVMVKIERGFNYQLDVRESPEGPVYEEVSDDDK